VELVLLTPLLVLLALVAVGFGRLGTSRLEVDAAARQAARAASLARDPATATAAARATAQAALAGDRLSCAGLAVTVELAAFAPGGTVAVTVACTTRLADVALVGLPAQVTLHGRFVSPVDTYRSVSGGGP
jgi:Flp pilus assembly protein TadG